MQIDYFSDSVPNLIGFKYLNTLEHEFTKQEQSCDFFTYVYSNYIKPNSFAILCISIFIIFLFIRYKIGKNNLMDNNTKQIATFLLNKKKDEKELIDFIAELEINDAKKEEINLDD